jgi:hypothetical protein
MLCPLLGGGGSGGGGGSDMKQPAVEFEAHLIHDSGNAVLRAACCVVHARGRTLFATHQRAALHVA